MPHLIESPLTRLSVEQLDQLGREFDAIHDEVRADLGTRDRAYITHMIELHRRLLVASRIVLFASRHRPAWLAGTTMLSLAKILENMEIGHNVMHGRLDWMNDPLINCSTWDWDSAPTAEAWKHSHNYMHHTYTNIRGKDRDLGYEIMRIDPHQKWNPVYLAQPFYNVVLAALSEWGVAVHDLDFDAIKRGEKSKQAIKRELRGMAVKGRAQIVKDYLAFPVISAGLAAGATVLGGNLGYQVEHHLYPDMPSTRYAEIAPRVREICDRFDLPYNTGPFTLAGRRWRSPARSRAAATVEGSGWGGARVSDNPEACDQDPRAVGVQLVYRVSACLRMTAPVLVGGPTRARKSTTRTDTYGVEFKEKDHDGEAQS